MKNIDSVDNPTQTVNTPSNALMESNQLVVIEFTAHIHGSKVLGGGNHIVRVAYNSLSQRLRSIHRLGGKVTNVYIPHFQEVSDGVVPVPQFAPSLAVEQPQQQVDVTEPEVITDAVVSMDLSSDGEVIQNLTINQPKVAEKVTENMPEMVMESLEPTAKPRKPRSSSKSASGFNKPKAESKPESKTSKAAKKPKK
ncbi:MAG: phycobilisome linker polypeptide [Pseudanabaenaceae cyanobacterium bins.39]|nr:phycobilisome linker polypeptide [Pseudanabaenaceae cyanobacterium bins.39]